MARNIPQHKSTIWITADLLRGCGIKGSEWPSYMIALTKMLCSVSLTDRCAPLVS